uniref:endopeptidase La n=1 Tax=candidate division WOR-3 bacterium TaxID=2052148 RepID=A0A7C6EBY1_UNCW3
MKDINVLKRFEVPKEKLRWRCDPARLGFKTTDELTASTKIVGQRRAVEALKMGLEIESLGYNIFVTGPVGTGRTATVKHLLAEIEKDKKTPDDKCYVNNFKNPDMPRLIRLPAGKGKRFQKDMNNLIDYLVKNIPLILESERYQKQKTEIVEGFKEQGSAKVREFEKKVAQAGFTLVQTVPFARPELVFVLEKTPVKIADLAAAVEEKKLSKEEYEKIKQKYLALTEELSAIFNEIKEFEKRAREALVNLDQDMIKPLVAERISEIQKHYKNEKVNEYLSEVETSILENLDLFRSPEAQSSTTPTSPAPVIDPFLEYRVNVIVDNSDAKGAPVIFETAPSYKNLFGTIERVWDRSGQWRTDFTKIKAGSLLRADGGYLVIEARDALIEPGVWPALKRTLRDRVMDIQSYDPYSFLALSALKPEPIEISVKVIMIGDAYLYSLLYVYDEDFAKVFKIRADFDWTMNLNDEALLQYSTVIKTIAEKEKLRPFDQSGVAAVIEYGVRLAGRKNKISTRFNIIADILKEANYLAGKENAKVVTQKYVDEAIEKRIDRVRLIEEKIQEMIEQGLILIDTEGSVIGQVNGLSVYDTGEYSFGRPSRITAKTAVGTQGIINIEREAQLSGRIHDKGVLILSGYLRDKYAQDKPLVMSGSICFEQSYEGVEGDSASSTEIYALLSSLAELPIRQDIAVTGSVNQKGEIQPIGGVNQKIEGFYDVCKAKGLTGKQGVIIPKQNIEDLMLRKDVAKAIEQGKFHLYAVETIDQGIEILTGVKAGEKNKDGEYPPGTVNYLVNKKLVQLAENWKRFRAEAKEES